MFRRAIIFIITLIVSLVGAQILSAQQPTLSSTNQTTVVVFVRNGCTHCQAEEQFLETLLRERKDVAVRYYRLENANDRKVWDEFTTRVESSKVTPITVVGDKYIVGFDKAETTGKDIITLINKAQQKNLSTDLSTLTKQNEQGVASTCDSEGLVPCEVNPSYMVNLPLIGKIDANKYPLLFLSAMFGFFDGFNPCAMWVLVTFLIILLQVGDRKKMFLFAGTFIAAEAIMYTLILVVWYKTWDFVQLDTIITPIVGIVSIFGGILFLREWHKKELECRVTDYKQRKEIRDKILNLASSKFTLFTFLSILGIAFSVNVIEFACSIGIPQAFTKILELNKLPLIENALYIGTYILFYMIDDFIVFGIALYGIDKLALTTKYSKLSNLIGGIVMVILGLIMLFKPSLILF